MHIDEVVNMISADMWLVSPVKRAIQTALTLFNMGLRRVQAEMPDAYPNQPPTFEIMPNLREKVESSSDKPGMHGMGPLSHEVSAMRTSC